MSQTTVLERDVNDTAGSKPAPPSSRRVLFISHANPQDNTFAAWLAAQLAIAGYEVWCDVTKLLGGEAWWSDIDQAIAQNMKPLFGRKAVEAVQGALRWIGSNRQEGAHEIGGGVRERFANKGRLVGDERACE